MFIKQKLALVTVAVASISLSAIAAAAGQTDGTLQVDATLVSACTISGSPVISFGSFSSQLAGDKTADSGTTLMVACSSDLTPLISAAGARVLVKGANNLPFNLSQTADAVADNLPLTVATGEAIVGFTKDGTPYPVHLYARALTAGYLGLQSGLYNAAPITVSVSY